MKKNLLFIAVLAFCLNLKAGELLYPKLAAWTEVYTNITFSSNITATTTFTNVQNCHQSTFHTFQFFYGTIGTNGVGSLGTNSTTVNLDRSIDAVNWMPVQTNTLTGSTNSFEYSTTGKWAQYRWRVTASATNAAMQANYMAQ